MNQELFPRFVMLKIFKYTEKLEAYMFYNKWYYAAISKEIKKELFQWKYLVRKYPAKFGLYINLALYSNDLEVIKFAAAHGADKFDRCLSNSNLEIVKFALANGARDINRMLLAENMTVVQMAIHRGATNYEYMLYTNILEKAKLGIELGARNYDHCMSSANLDVVKLTEEYGSINYERCLESKNIEVVKYGLSKGAGQIVRMFSTDEIDIINLGISFTFDNDLRSRSLWKETNGWDPALFMGSKHLDLVQQSIKMGATNYDLCLTSSNVKVNQIGINHGSKKYEYLLLNKNITSILLALKIMPK